MSLRARKIALKHSRSADNKNAESKFSENLLVAESAFPPFFTKAESVFYAVLIFTFFHLDTKQTIKRKDDYKITKIN